MKMTLLEMVQDIPKSTRWARKNKDILAIRDKERRGTLDGKLISLITQSKYRCKTSRKEHTIDTHYLRGLYYGQEGRCALSGITMTISGERGTPNYWFSISLDRIDSSLGYIDGNVQLVCTGVNYMKKDMTDTMFIDFCKRVAEANP